MANTIARVLLAASTLIALSAQAAPTNSSDPRGPIVQSTRARVPGAPASEGPEQPLQPLVGVMSGGYRSMHFNEYFTSSFSGPFQITADNDTLFVSDSTANVVQLFQITAGGVSFIRSFGSAGSGAGQFNGPEQVAVVGNEIYVADYSNNRVQRFNKTTGAYVSQYGAPGTGPGQFDSPSGLVYNPINGLLYVSEVGNDRVQVFNTSGTYQFQFAAPGAGNGQLNNPYAMAIDSAGNIYVADTANGRVSKFDSSGAWIRHIAVGAINPIGIAVDNSNFVWVTSDSGDMYVYDAFGNYNSYYYGSAPPTWQVGYFTDIRGIAITQPLTVSPFNGTPAVAVVDSGSHTVQLFSRSVQPTAHPSISSLGPSAYVGQMAFDSAENVYFADSNNNQVYKYDKSAH